VPRLLALLAQDRSPSVALADAQMRLASEVPLAGCPPFVCYGAG
jgi:hypothetical protein